MGICIITGASSGIGRATAIALAERGEYDSLILIARSADGLAETSRLASGHGRRIETICFDMEDLDGIPSLVEGIYSRHGSIDALINIAGYTEPAALPDTDMSNMMKTYTVNVFAPFAMIKECVKYMDGGKIINIASTAGSTPRPGWLAYASSKAAVISMSKTLSAELAEYKIKVYCVSPGRCATALRRKLAPDEDQSKIMQPSAVADVILRLCGSDEKYLDGQDIIVRML